MPERIVVNRFSELLAIKERRENRRISRRQVGRETGLPKKTLDMYAKNEVIRFDRKVIKTLCDYFDCTIGEFLIIEEVISPEMEAPLLASA